MKDMFWNIFYLVTNSVRGIFLVVVLFLAAVFVVPRMFAAEPPEPCVSCAEHQETNAALREEIEELRSELNSQHQLRRRIDIRFLPELGLEWLEIHTISFWDEVSPRHCRQCQSEPREVIWFSTFLECALTTIDHSCTG